MDYHYLSGVTLPKSLDTLIINQKIWELAQDLLKQQNLNSIEFKLEIDLAYFQGQISEDITELEVLQILNKNLIDSGLVAYHTRVLRSYYCWPYFKSEIRIIRGYHPMFPYYLC